MVQVRRLATETGLADGTLDAALDVALPLSERIHRQRVSSDRFVVAARKAHPRVRPGFTLATYLAEKHVMVTSRRRGPGAEDIELGQRPAPPCQPLRNYLAAFRVVAESDLVLTMPARYAPLLAAGSAAVRTLALPLRMPTLSSSIGTTASTTTRPIAGFACSSSRRWARLPGVRNAGVCRVSFDARPTVAGPDDDPYLWLEDIEGRRALAWVEAENDRTLKTFGGAVRRRPRHPGGDPRPARQAPLRRAARTVALQFLARRQEPARPVAAHSLEFRLDQPAWEILLDIDALAAAEGEDWIWGRCDAARHARPRDPASLARRQRRRRAARVRPARAAPS